MTIATHSPRPYPQPPFGVACRKCGATSFRQEWRDHPDGGQRVALVCEGCDLHHRWLVEESGPDHQIRIAEVNPSHPAFQPPPARSRWVALLRQTDGLWRPIASSGTLSGVWDAVSYTWQKGDVLAIPVKPE